MTIETAVFILAILAGLYMAWNIGANDVANAIATCVGSGSLRLRTAVILASFLEFFGAFFGGSEVSLTIQKSIVSTEIFTENTDLFVYGMISSLLAAGAWLQIASYFGLPVSTTHTIVGAVLGFGIAFAGIEAVHWVTVAYILSSWFISPLLGAIISYFFFQLILTQIFYAKEPGLEAKKRLPHFVFFVVFLFLGGLLFDGKQRFYLDFSLTTAIILVLLTAFSLALMSRLFLGKLKTGEVEDPSKADLDPKLLLSLQKTYKHLFRAGESAGGQLKYTLQNIASQVATITESVQQRSFERKEKYSHEVERIFSYLQVLSVSCMAFAHGSNDVANAIGPLSAVIVVLKEGQIPHEWSIPSGVLFLGAFGIVVGLASWGWRVVETIGKGITELTPSRGFAAEFGAASTILLASKLGLPISTTHTLVGSVLGVGLARGIGALNLNTLKDIFLSWIVTIPAGFCFSIFFFYVLRFIF